MDNTMHDDEDSKKGVKVLLWHIYLALHRSNNFITNCRGLLDPSTLTIFGDL